MAKKIFFACRQIELGEDVEAAKSLDFGEYQFDLTCIYDPTDLEHDQFDTLVKKNQPDLLVLSYDVLKTRDSWDYDGISIAYHAMTYEELENGAIYGLPTIGVASTADEVLQRLDRKPYSVSASKNKKKEYSEDYGDDYAYDDGDNNTGSANDRHNPQRTSSRPSQHSGGQRSVSQQPSARQSHNRQPEESRVNNRPGSSSQITEKSPVKRQKNNSIPSIDENDDTVDIDLDEIFSDIDSENDDEDEFTNAEVKKSEENTRRTTQSKNASHNSNNWNDRNANAGHERIRTNVHAENTDDIDDNVQSRNNYRSSSNRKAPYDRKPEQYEDEYAYDENDEDDIEDPDDWEDIETQITTPSRSSQNQHPTRNTNRNPGSGHSRPQQKKQPEYDDDYDDDDFTDWEEQVVQRQPKRTAQQVQHRTAPRQNQQSSQRTSASTNQRNMSHANDVDPDDWEDEEAPRQRRSSAQTRVQHTQRQPSERAYQKAPQQSQRQDQRMVRQQMKRRPQQHESSEVEEYGDDGYIEQEFKKDLVTEKHDTSVITVYSAKGGVGKTTIATELAVYLSLVSIGRRKLNVCLVDYNIDFGDVRMTLNLSAKNMNLSNWAAEVKELMEQGDDPDDITYSSSEIMQYLSVDKKSGLHILQAPLTNEDSMDISSDSLGVILDNLIKNGGFDYIICDTGNNTRDSTMIALDRADTILMIMTQNTNTANCDKAFMSTMNAIEFDLSNVKLVINEIMPQKATKISVQEIIDFFPFECVGKIRFNTDVIKATNMAEPLSYQPDHEFTKQIRSIVTYILQQDDYEVDTKPKKKLFSFLHKK